MQRVNLHYGLNMNEDVATSDCLTFLFNYTNLPEKCKGDAPVNLKVASQGHTSSSEDVAIYVRTAGRLTAWVGQLCKKIQGKGHP